MSNFKADFIDNSNKILIDEVDATTTYVGNAEVGSDEASPIWVIRKLTIAGTAINITDAGTGTHTMSRLLHRYTNGAGVQAVFFNPAATALGAATPSLSLGYTNSAQVASRATPGVLPVGKTAASNSLILYTGTGAGKYNYNVPLASGDAGIAEINTIQNSVSYVSGSYTVALVKEIARVPITTLGVAAERDLVNQLPSLPRIYDGAALYVTIGSSTTTPANANFSGHLTTIWS